MAMSLGSFTIGFIVGLTVGEVGLFLSLALFRAEDPTGVETEGPSDLMTSIR